MTDIERAVWLVIKTKPRQEERARENLERQGFTVFLPRFAFKKRVRGQWRSVIEPLFQGYVFVYTNPHLVSLAPVRSTMGVSDLVRFGQKVVPVPDEVISYLQSRDQEFTSEQAQNLPFFSGDRVDVLAGPFAGLPAVYQMAKGADRAMLLVSLLGRENTVAVPYDHIAPAR